MIQHKTFVFNAFQENTYLIFDDESREAILVDPGAHTAKEREVLNDAIEKNALRLTSIWLTHSHIDHVLGLRSAVELYKVPYHQSVEDVANLKAVSAYAPASYGIHDFAMPDKPAQLIEAGQYLEIGAFSFEALATPGHAAGHLSFYNRDFGLIAGDALFNGSIGRTDLPGCSFPVLEKSIQSQLYTLPDETLVFPGHGPTTSIGHEKRFNPFVRAQKLQGRDL